MATKLQTAFSSLSDLKLWFKVQSGGQPNLADIPEIISLRWTFFRDRWEFIKDGVLSKKDRYAFPNMLVTQVSRLDDFIVRQRNSINTAINPFSNNDIITDYYAVWDNIDAASIPITRQEQKIIDDKMQRVKKFVKTDFQRIRRDMVVARDEIADVIGLSDSNYNSTRGRSSIAQLRTPRISDVTNMQTLHVGIVSTDFILANINTLSTTSVDPFALARQNADNDEVTIRDGRSARLVKMNYGDGLADLAKRYLGDPDRWIEIAIANGLKQPYIDEIGEAIPLISNGDGNQINVGPIDPDGNKNINKFYINQVVFLESSTVKFPEQRNIINIREVPVSGEIVIEFSGELNLDKFKIADNAVVRVFKPNTINSNFLVAIPSEQPLEQQQVGETPYFLQSKSDDEKRAGVDFAINDDADLVLTSSNDLQLSFGLANALQAVKLKMVSEKGQSPRHLNYGLPSVTGKKANDPDVLRRILIDGINDMINADSRFDRIETLDVRQESGNAIGIGLVVRMAGTGTLVPISFTINTG